MAVYGVCCSANSCALSSSEPWYGCVVADQGTLINLYHKYSFGQLDNYEAISSDYQTAMVNCALGLCNHELTRVSADVSVGESISSLGQYIDFNVEVQEAAPTMSATTNAFTI